MLLVPLTLFKFVPGPLQLVNRHCFLFAAHHHSCFGLTNLMATRVHRTCCKHRRLVTCYLILTQQSHIQLTMHTTTRFPYKLISSSVSLSPSHHYEQRIRHLRVHDFQAPIQTMHVSSVQKYVVVRERRLCGFKEEWERILKERGVAEPFWSVKWIIEHILRKHPHNEVHLSLSLSLCVRFSLYTHTHTHTQTYINVVWIVHVIKSMFFAT